MNVAGGEVDAARRSGSIQTRIAMGRPPTTSTRWMPDSVVSCGWSVRQPVGQRRHGALGGSEAEVKRRVRPVGALHLDDWGLGLGGQLGPHLLEPRRDLRQRGGAAVVQLQAHRDDADSGAAGRFDVVDAADGRYRAFDGRGEKPADRLAPAPV